MYRVRVDSVTPTGRIGALRAEDSIGAVVQRLPQRAHRHVGVGRDHGLGGGGGGHRPDHVAVVGVRVDPAVNVILAQEQGHAVGDTGGLHHLAHLLGSRSDAHSVVDLLLGGLPVMAVGHILVPRDEADVWAGDVEERLEVARDRVGLGQPAKLVGRIHLLQRLRDLVERVGQVRNVVATIGLVHELVVLDRLALGNEMLGDLLDHAGIELLVRRVRDVEPRREAQRHDLGSRVVVEEAPYARLLVEEVVDVGEIRRRPARGIYDIHHRVQFPVVPQQVDRVLVRDSLERGIAIRQVVVVAVAHRGREAELSSSDDLTVLGTQVDLNDAGPSGHAAKGAADW